MVPSRTLPIYGVADAASPDGFTDTVNVPLLYEAESHVPPKGVVTCVDAVTVRFVGTVVTDSLLLGGDVPPIAKLNGKVAVLTFSVQEPMVTHEPC